MEMKIKIVPEAGKESGVVIVHKANGSGMKKIGEIKYNDESDKKWLIMVLTENHPQVSILQ